MKKMVLKIRSIPVLKGKEAKRFIKEANKAFKSKGSVDFSKQYNEMIRIIKKI